MEEQPDIKEFAHEDWKQGTRVVELGQLAEQLSTCRKYGLPVELLHCFKERRYGLGNLLHFECKTGRPLIQVRRVNNTHTHTHTKQTEKKKKKKKKKNKKKKKRKDLERSADSGR